MKKDLTMVAASSRRKPSQKSALHGAQSRLLMERAMLIHDAIASGTFPNCTKLSRKVEVNRHTILRDIQFMQEQLRLPIAYNKSRR